ncbi:unnamed protein product [Orchesella dallaii]|uniref:Uncharacterized protein n=1 Tax=Orchesella dallaii TaxID=48710 RepID=A0ABP1PTD5_9HEXA
MLSVALCLFDGIGVAKNLEKGLSLWPLEAESPASVPGRMNSERKNDAVLKAQCGLGWLFSEGVVDDAKDKLKENYLKTEEEDYKEKEVVLDPKQGHHYLNLAVKLGDPHGAAALINYYLRHMKLDKAFEAFKMVKEVGHEGLVQIQDDEFWAATEPRADCSTSDSDSTEISQSSELSSGSGETFDMEGGILETKPHLAPQAR